jgi:hypothetical protein
MILSVNMISASETIMNDVLALNALSFCYSFTVNLVILKIACSIDKNVPVVLPTHPVYRTWLIFNDPFVNSINLWEPTSRIYVRVKF